MNLNQTQLFILFLTSAIVLPVAFSLPFKRNRRIKSEKEKNFAETGYFETDYERADRETKESRVKALKKSVKINIYQHLGDWNDK